MKKSFTDWMYWKGTWWVVMFYLVVVPAFAVFGDEIGDSVALFFAVLLFPWYCWMKNYEKNYHKMLDKE